MRRAIPGPIVLDALAQQAATTPNALAVTDAEASWDYARLWRASGQSAAALHAAGASGKPVLLALPSSARWLAALIGIWRAGAIAVPLDLRHPSARLTELAHHVRAAALVTDTGQPPAWAPGLPSMRPGNGSGPTARTLQVDLPKGACVFFTSGTTGRPKPVLITHAALAHRCAVMRRLYAINAQDRVAQLSSPAFDAVLWEILPVLAAGGRLVIATGKDRLPGPDLARWLGKQEITAFTCTPTALASMPFTDLPALRLIVAGGEALHTGPLDPWLARYQVANAYGPTEATIEALAAKEVLPGQHPVPIGRPLPGVGAHILNAHQQPVPVGEAGELYLSGVGLAAGYLGDPEETARAFPALDLGPEGTRRCYRTGDLVRQLPDGQYTFLGRLDTQLNLAGVRVEPGEIEAAALHAPGITAAAALPLTLSGRTVLALAATGEPDEAELRAHLAAHLPPAAVPTHIHRLGHLPYTPNGKIDYAALAITLTTSPVAATTTAPAAAGTVIALPDRVASWWQEATGHHPSEGDFFTDGGTSLQALRLLAQINEAYDAYLTIGDFVADPTPAHLARALASRPITASSPEPS